MEINKNKVVAITYTLEVNGKIADQATEAKPLEFIFGQGMLIPKFEENLDGKKEGEDFKFHHRAEEGYGQPNPQAIIEIPKNVFEVDGQLREDLLVVGNSIPMSNAEGQVIPGVVLEVLAESVKMDFNHPMAGKDLDFSGKVLSVREATEAEIQGGLNQQAAGGCDGCQGCSDGSCEDGCGDGNC